MEEDLQDKPIELPDPQQIRGLVRRRRWHFLLPFFLGWLLVWGASWFMKSIYRSGTLILVEQPAVPEKFVVSNIDIDIQQQLGSITQQILSRTRLLHIIDSLNLYAKDRKRMSPDDMVEKMRRDIDIELVRNDNRKLSAFNIYYMNPDPKLAQRTTSELANLFITENLEQRQKRSESTTTFLEDQLAQARDSLTTQEARVRDFKDKHLGELPSQTQSNLQILSGLQTQLQAQEEALNRAKQQSTYLESLLAQYHTLEHNKSAEGGTSGLATIDKELDRLRSQLADLSSHYTNNYPDVRKTREQIARTEKMRARLVAEMNTPDTSASTAATAVPLDIKSAPVLDLESQLKANKIEITNRQAEINDLQLKIGQYQSRLNQAPVMEQQFADITRDYDQSKANYDSLLAKKNQSEMATDLEKTQQGEHFTMLDPPDLPAKPYKPNRLKLGLLGLVVGFALGGLTAAGAELLAGKVYTENEIKKLLPFEVIAEIPPLDTPSEIASRKRSTLLAGIATAMIFLCILAGSAITYLRG